RGSSSLPSRTTRIGILDGGEGQACPSGPPSRMSRSLLRRTPRAPANASATQRVERPPEAIASSTHDSPRIWWMGSRRGGAPPDGPSTADLRVAGFDEAGDPAITLVDPVPQADRRPLA